MKKLLILSLLPALLVSCLKEDDDKFPQSASQRLQAAVTEAQTTLQSAANGWRMEIYPEKERIYGGYTLFLKFNADGTVTAASEQAGADKTATSYYTIEGESGAILSFDTYNEIFHFYSSPSTGAEQGIGTANGGLEGDSDFVVMETSPGFVKLKGRKSNNYAYLYPLESGVDWTSEMDAYIKAAEAMDMQFLNCTVDGTQYPVTMRMRVNNFTARVFSIAYTPDAGDQAAAVEEIKAPYVCTKTGIRFYSPLTIGNKTVTEMTFKEDYYLESEDGSVRISAAEPIRSDNRFTIEVTDVTYSSATVAVTPTIDDEYYYWAIYDKATIEQQGDKTIIRSIEDEMNSYIGTYTPEFVIENLGWKGPSNGTFENKLSPESDYVVVAMGLSITEDGKKITGTTDLFKEEFRTGDLPPFEDGYAAWIGTWEVTSTTSEKTKSPQTLEVKISYKVPNLSFNVEGWGITTTRTYAVTADWDAETGGVTIANGQVVGKSGEYDITFISRCPNKDSYTIVTGDYTGMIGTMGPDGTTATMEGNKLPSGWEIYGMDFFALKGTSYAQFYAASGYTDFDYAFGPFSMKKISGWEKATRALPGAPKPERIDSRIWQPETALPVVDAGTCASADQSPY